MPAVNPPAAIANIPGLPTVLRNGGWQLLTDRPLGIGIINSFTIATVRPGGTNLGYTVRMRHRAMFQADHLVLVFGNWTGDNNSWESPGPSTLKVRAALQRIGAGGLTDETGQIVPVTFGGKTFGEISPGAVLMSDPIPFSVAKNEIFFVRSGVFTAGTGYLIPVSSSLGGGTNFDGVNNGEGYIVDDGVMVGNTTQTTTSHIYAPSCVLAFSPNKQRSVVFIGDSITASTGDGGEYTSNGGYLQRVMVNLTNLAIDNNFVTNTIANFPFAKCPRGGYTLWQAAVESNSYSNLRIAELASTVICEFGVNDLGAQTLAQMQANYLQLAARFTARGIKFIQCTITPRTTSTDGWLTVANQSQLSFESVRQGVNAWLRDPSAAGFVAQANAPGLVDVWDAAAAVEVNGSGVQTLNGGYWMPAISASDATGTVTSSPSSSGFFDSTKTQAANTWRGYCLAMTSGAANGSIQPVNWSTAAGQFGLTGTLSSSPAIGDSYKLYRPVTIDGTHPSTNGHQLIANSLNTPANLAKVI